MGNEISLPKIRTMSSADESMTLRMQNNYRPLHFHAVHGDNIKLMKNRKVACRHEGFCKSIAFSDRPVMVYEPIHVKFVEIASNWSGALRIGFTTNDPASVRTKLPRYACPDFTCLPGNWAKAIPERMAKKDSILYYYVDQNGDVHYGIDSEEHGIFFGGVNTSSKLWAVFDIYGNTVTIEFMDPSFLTPDGLTESQSNIISLTPNNRNQGILENYKLPNKLAFHSLRGKNALLKINNLVASRKEDSSSLAYVFTERPLNLNEKVMIRVLKVNNHINSPLVYGITSCNPETLQSCDLPANTEDLIDRLEYWVVRRDTNSYDIDDLISYSINNEGEVEVAKNFQPSAKFYVDPTQPLWLFLNICGSISEMHLIGSSFLDEHEIARQFEKSLSISGSLFSNEQDIASVTISGNEIPGASSQQASNECVICCEHLANCALYRCGHVCMCYNCACKIWKPNSKVECPLCRKIILDVIKIYT